MKVSLFLRALNITHAPGFPRGGLPPMHFCDGLNIVYGPNASGKTTTAQAIRTLFWPASDTQGLLLEAEIALNGQVGNYRCRNGLRDGTPDLGYLGDQADRYRYLLAQHELLTADDGETRFVERILTEARGGLDLEAALQDLGYADPPKRLTTEYRDAKWAYSKSRESQRDTQRAEAQLALLESQLQTAKAAQQRSERLLTALTFLRQHRVLEAAKAAFQGFPTVLAGMNGQELEDFDRFTAELSEAEAGAVAADRECATARQRRDALGLPDPAAAECARDMLGEAISALDACEKALDAGREALTRAVAAADTAYRNLGGTAEHAAADPLDQATVQALGAFTRKAEKLTARQTSISDSLAWIESAAPATATDDPDRLREAITCLQAWLATADLPPSAALFPVLAFSGMSFILGLLSFILERAYLGGTAALLILVTGVMLLLSRKAHASRRDPRQLQDVFLALHLDSAPAWSRPEVEQYLKGLQQRLATALLARTAQIKHGELEKQRAALDAEIHELDGEAGRLARILGVEPDHVYEQSHALWYFVDQLIAWQRHRTEAAAEREALTLHQRDHADALTRASAALEPYGYAPATNTAELRWLRDKLTKRINDRQVAVAEETEKEKLSAERRERARSASNRRTALMERLALSPDPETARRELDHLIAQLPEYKAASQQRDHAAAICDATEEQGRIWADWAALLAGNEEMLQREYDEKQAKAELAESLHQLIGQTREQIRAAKAQSACEEAQTALDRALARLTLRLEDGLRAQIGRALVHRLGAAIADTGLPVVFRRAQELFAAFTNGRYELRIDAAAGDFRAEDLGDNVVRTLSQLSSATRVQLLMAVRVAFVEEREPGPRLPLLMDETLACSDEMREHAIIDAALQICRAGRQVFYFTSKPSELAKWQAQAAQAGVELRILPLETLPDDVRAPVSSMPIPRLLDPADMNYVEYGQALGVGRIDFSLAPAGYVHIWHAMDDPAALHKLLEAGIVRCGQLLNPHLHEVIDTLAGANASAKARARASVLVDMERRWREGRGLPLTLQDLQQSGILSTDAFRTDIPQLAQDLNWDAGALLEALEAGRVKRLRSDSINRLRAYAEEHGQLVEGEPLSPDELHALALSDANDIIASGILSASDVRELFDRVFPPVPA